MKRNNIITFKTTDFKHLNIYFPDETVFKISEKEITSQNIRKQNNIFHVRK